MKKIKYRWSIGNRDFALRYVNWKGKDKIFADVVDENGEQRTFELKTIRTRK